MIEMLGVLAIIGVLSVGGIAGYTKAMEMYNSNLQRQQLRELIAGMLQIQPSLNFKIPSTSITAAFDALDLIPKGLTYKNPLLCDTSGNCIQIKCGTSNSLPQYVLFIEIARGLSKRLQRDYCLNALQFAKENANVIKSVMLQKYKSSSSIIDYFYGNDRCLGKRKCLKDLSLVQMQKNCQTFCVEDYTCVFYINLL